MKRNYFEPEAEWIRFHDTDLIRTSEQQEFDEEDLGDDDDWGSGAF